jgi:hypothetical protein
MLWMGLGIRSHVLGTQSDESLASRTLQCLYGAYIYIRKETLILG